MTRDLGEWGGPVRPPVNVSSAHGALPYEVMTVNRDGTVDLRNRRSRATRARVPGIAGWTPSVGDHVLAIDVANDQQDPAIIVVQRAAIAMTGTLGTRVTALEADVAALQDEVTIKDHVTFPGASQFAVKTVTHNLGLTVPYGALVTANEQTGAGEMVAYTRSHTTNDLMVVIKDTSGSPTNGTTCKFTLRISP